MIRRFSWVVPLGLILSVPGCYRGYKSAEDLKHDERGPDYCASSCSELGMRMAAFVLVENSTSGCVCEPVSAQSAPAGGSSTTPAEPATPREEQAPQPAPSGESPETKDLSMRGSKLRGAIGAAAAQYVVIVARRAAAAAAAQQQQQQQRIQTYH